MKFTTAIALTAFLGNAAFSNGALDVCNRDDDGLPGGYGKGPCNKQCQHPDTLINFQVKIQCLVDLDGDGKFEDCFDPAVTAGECRDVDIQIIYKYHNNNKNIPLDVKHGDMDSLTPTSWMAFNGTQVLYQGEIKHSLQPNSAVNYRNKDSDGKNIPLATINTCDEILVEMKSKVLVPKDSRTTDITSDWYTSRCGISGKILLCDTECKEAWEDAQGGDQAPEPAPSAPSAPEPTPSDTDPSNPSPSSPSKGGTKAPSAGKKTKTPTIGKGKGTEPAKRKLKNRKVVRV